VPDNDADIGYYVLADRAVAYLLARVRWPDVAQAISAASPDWLDDTGLFDLPYDPGSVLLSFEQAASVAAGWGTQLHAEPARDAPSYIRRMPANWSELTPSERGAWGLEFVGKRRAPVRRIRRPALVPTARDRAEIERRNDARVQLGGRAHIWLGHTTLSAALVDLSEHGARCVLPEKPWPVAPGDALAGPLVLEVESNDARICLDVTSRISWQRSTGDGTQFGVSFTELTRDERRGVQRFLSVPRRHRSNGLA
jgi:hypothetical protein